MGLGTINKERDQTQVTNIILQINGQSLQIKPIYSILQLIKGPILWKYCDFGNSLLSWEYIQLGKINNVTFYDLFVLIETQYKGKQQIVMILLFYYFCNSYYYMINVVRTSVIYC